MLYLGPAAKNSRNQALSARINDWQQYYQQQATQAPHALLRQFYTAGMVSANTPVAAVPLLALDFETTGLDAANNGIVSIGLVPMTLNRIYSSQARQWLLKPRFDMTDQAITLHGITHSDIARAPDLSDILPTLLKALAGKVAVVHYRGIERNFLHAALTARLGAGVLFPVIDTMALEARLHRRPLRNWWQQLLGKKPLSIRLADSRLRYNLPPYRPHHAATDALACAELLQAQLAWHFSADTPISRLWC